MESAVSEVLAIQHFKNKKDRFNFDPEFSLFSQEKNLNGLAGLLPWSIQESKGGTKQHRPILGSDPIGTLTQSLARLKQADFMAVSKQKLCDRFPTFKGCSYLLFATHPLRELEKNIPSDSAKYLTFYAFSKNFNQPINPNGASAREVHDVISFLEEEITQGSISLTFVALEQAKEAGRSISKWLESSLKMGGDFLDLESSYFMPIPVALVAIIDTNLEATELH